MTADSLLLGVKEMLGERQQSFAPKVVSVDTLMLKLHLGEPELMQLITELEQSGQITFRPAVSRNYKLGTISLVG